MEVTVTLEIWPLLLPVPPLTILKKSEVPRSVNAGNVIALTRAKVYVASKLYKAARPRSVRINQELEERTKLFVLSGHCDHVFRTRHRRERRRLSRHIGVDLDLGPTGDGASPAGKDRRTEVERDCSGVRHG